MGSEDDGCVLLVQSVIRLRVFRRLGEVGNFSTRNWNESHRRGVAFEGSAKNGDLHRMEAGIGANLGLCYLAMPTVDMRLGFGRILAFR